MTEVKIRKKLIEVALPLDAINAASAREKSIRHGHPSTLHLWWARRPLAAARAVIFAQMVDDPSSHPERFPTSEEQDAERQRLFDIIEELVLWENTTNEAVERARAEIRRSWLWTCEENKRHPQAAELFDPANLPGFHDPVAGGGSLPLEAQRLGLVSHATDLNPVAVLINKAMIEILQGLRGDPRVNPGNRKEQGLLRRSWRGAEGLAGDVRYYGQWMREEAERRVGHLYPKVKVTDEMVVERADLEAYRGRSLTVIAWIWARTVRSPNPGLPGVHVPLVSSFWLSKKPGKEAYIEPVVTGTDYRFSVRVGVPPVADESGTKLSGASFRCLLSSSPIEAAYIKSEGKAGRIGSRLMAIVAEGDRGRVFLAPTPAHEDAAASAEPDWQPDTEFFQQALGFRVGNYGMSKWSDLFTPRQLVMLSTMSGLVSEVRDAVRLDASESGHASGEYADAVATYVAFLVSQVANHSSSLCGWNATNTQMRSVFARQALPMVWDFAESNPFSSSSGSFANLFDRQVQGLATLGCGSVGDVRQADANSQSVSSGKVVSTDPPYYDNIGYADLSDFFYVWLRRSLRDVGFELFATVESPKGQELVATPHRHGGRAAAAEFFLAGMTRAMERLARLAHPAFPVSIYYAFKQSESGESGDTSSTGWETFLDAVIRAGFSVRGTWPLRTEKQGRVRGNASNALASSVVLICRPRSVDAPSSTRRDLTAQMRSELPAAVSKLQQCNIAPVDLAQAAIGPGMAVFSKFSRILEGDGSPLRVREALELVNRVLDEGLVEQEGDFDPDTRWALAWFEEHRFAQGEYGQAETLSTAKNTSVRGIEEAGILLSRGGRVRLLKASELPAHWNPASDTRLTTWECVHHLIRVLESDGEDAAADLLAKLGPLGDAARELAYRLYAICERKKWAAEAKAYNNIVVSWSAIESLLGSAESAASTKQKQQDLPGM